MTESSTPQSPVPPSSGGTAASPGEAGLLSTNAQRPSAAGGRRDNLDFIKSLFLAVLVTALLYEVFPLPFIDQGRVLLLFDNSVSESIVGLALWSLFILFFKALGFRLQRRARRAFDHPRLRAVLLDGVYARDVEAVLGRMNAELTALKLKGFAESGIYRRVQRVLQYIRSAPKKESINDLLEYQAQIEVKKLDSSYAVLQVFIWAIPILGFIGTVLGIGTAINEFSDFIQTADGGAQFSMQMRAALGGVTSGLAIAFNTTFLALVLVIPVMLATSVLQKNEEENLLSIEEFCLEDLLPHLHITPADTVHENYEEHLHRIMQLSQTWLGQFEPLVQNLSRQSEMMSHQLAGIQPLVKEFTDTLLAGRGRAEASAETEAGEDLPAGRSEPESSA